MAAETITDAVMFGDVEPPADAVRVYGWQDDDGWHREFEGTEHNVAAVTLRVAGRQYSDGRCWAWTRAQRGAPDGADRTRRL
jgi:hypothetical protein